MRCTSLLTLLIASYLGAPLDSNTHKLVRRESNQSDSIHLLNRLITIGRGNGNSEGETEANAQVEAETPEKVEVGDDSDSGHTKTKGLLRKILNNLIVKKQKATEEAANPESSDKGITVDADLNKDADSEEDKSDKSTKLLTAKIGGRSSTPDTI